MRSFIRTLMGALKNYIYENYQLLAQHKRDEREMDLLRERVREERENLINLNAEYHRSMVHVQEDNMRRLYNEEEPEPVSAGLKRLDEREKKEMERRFQDLAKSNRQLTGELEKTRRKCEVVHEKYQSIKNLVSKDRNIGRQEEPSFIKQEKKLEKQQSNKLLLN